MTSAEQPQVPGPQLPGHQASAPEDVPIHSDSDMPAGETESGSEQKDDSAPPGGPNGKRQRQGSGKTKPPVIEKMEFTVEGRPDDLKNNEKDVRNMLSGKSTGDYRDMKEAQKQMWDSMTARMDHADEQAAKNFDKVAEHLNKQSAPPRMKPRTRGCTARSRAS